MPPPMLRWLLLLLPLLLAAGALGAHPECRWACDDPVCPAACQPVCAPPSCHVLCPGAAPSDPAPPECGAPQCEVRCPPDQAEADNCPACETVCAPLPDACACAIACAPTACQWRCAAPQLTCRRPLCQLVCERPACEAALPGAPPTAACLARADQLFDVHCRATRTCNVAVAADDTDLCYPAPPV